MKSLFVNTAGWVAMADSNHPRHLDCRRVRDEWLGQGGLLVTSDYVLDETLTLIRMRLGIDSAEMWWDQVAQSHRLKVEWITPERAEKARSWFFRWRDKSFSFTDCASFVVLRELKIKKALTVDRHFLEAGFETLPSIRS